MATLGETKKAYEIGYKGRATYVWRACPDCGLERWVVYSNVSGICNHCGTIRERRNRYPLTYNGEEAKLGDTATADMIGLEGRGVHVYDACPQCGVIRWVRRRQKGILCINCASANRGRETSGEKSGRWKGGTKTSNGYRYITILSSDPYFSMVSHSNRKSGLILEHRYIMACHLGRVLKSNEVVHHINGVKSDNRIENLQVLIEKYHNSTLVLQNLQEQLRQAENRITLLEAELSVVKSIAVTNWDSGISDNMNIVRYNTPGNLDNEVEGIVHPLSNEGNNNESV